EEMSIGVPLAMRETDVRYERAQGLGQIGRDVGICILVDGDRAGRVRHDNRGDALAVRERLERTLHVWSDDEDLLARRGADGEGLLAEHGRDGSRRAAHALSVVGFRLSVVEDVR